MESNNILELVPEASLYDITKGKYGQHKHYADVIVNRDGVLRRRRQLVGSEKKQIPGLLQVQNSHQVHFLGAVYGVGDFIERFKQYIAYTVEGDAGDMNSPKCIHFLDSNTYKRKSKGYLADWQRPKTPVVDKIMMKDSFIEMLKDRRQKRIEYENKVGQFLDQKMISLNATNYLLSNEGNEVTFVQDQGDGTDKQLGKYKIDQNGDLEDISEHNEIEKGISEDDFKKKVKDLPAFVTDSDRVWSKDVYKNNELDDIESKKIFSEVDNLLKENPDMYKTLEKNYCEEQDVSIQKLILEQNTLSKDKMIAKYDSDKLPEIWRFQGELLLSNGYHRIANKILEGNSKVRVTIYDIDKYLKDNKIEKAQNTRDYGTGKHADVVKVTRNGKTFERKQVVGRKQEDKEPEKQHKYTPQELEKHARAASEEDLNRTIKQHGDEAIRVAAHKELDRRHKEEHVQEPDAKDGKSKDVKSKKQVDPEKERLKKESAERNKWIEKYSKYKLNHLPIDIPEKDVQVNTSGDVDSHWILKWVNPKNNKTQYAFTEKLLQKNADYKWERMQQITDKDINKVKDVASKALKSNDEKERQIGAVLSIIVNTGLRIGSQKGFEETENRGVTTLSPDNIKVKGDTVELEFVGKSYKNNTVSINDKELASYLGQMKDMKKGENFVFDKVNDSTVRRFFHENISPDWKVKDLRTWVATDMGRKVLEQDSTPPPPLPKNPKEAQKLIQNKLTNLYKVVSRRLNNTPAMAKEAYIHPKVTEEWLKKIGAQL